MGKKLKITPGDRFNRFTIVQELPIKKLKGGTERSFVCKCDCGEVRNVRLRCLRSGNSKSCGCYNKEMIIKAHTKHGMSPRGGRMYEYGIWSGMRQRCNNSNASGYKYYGGAGIRVCEAWDDFKVFLSDVGPAPTRKHTLDRADPNGDYEKSNCSWETRATQARNTRRLRSTNSSGRRGVSWHRGAGKWAASITVNYKSIYLGLFLNKDDAARAFDAYVVDNNLEHTKNF